MKYIYLLFMVFSCSSLLAQQSAIKRASLTHGSQTSENGKFMVQQSVGFLGAMQTQNLENHNVTRGFLLPQATAVEPTLPTTPKMEWALYPNPFSTHINIEFSQAVSGDMHITLFDVTGQLVYNKTHTAKQQQKIPFDALAQGEYLIQVRLMNHQFSAQLINYSTKHRSQ
ncbi:MAG: T9SS type A sorting domain-containing protein [Flavobacteriaceae bacterium]|jgi:hypothetical protein|nr:T9SS type A sorting domain-containing protein [Flavobacteriaceae bacterium]